jgi:hypothetical protein
VHDRRASREGSLLGWRDERLAFFNDIDHVQFHGFISCTFIVNGAVGNCQRLPRVQDAFRLAVQLQPEVTLDDVGHDHTGWLWRPALKPAAISKLA